MKKLFLSTVLIAEFAFATSTNEILDLVENNYSLKEKDILIKSTKLNEELSMTWQNPVVGFGMNDINFDEPSSRDLEAMQTQYITYSQVLPTNGKLEILNEISTFDTKIKQLEYNNFKLKLKSQALLYGYNISIKNNKLKIIDKYIENLDKEKELMNLLYENGKLDKSKLVGIDIKRYKLKLQKQKLQYSLFNMKSKLENIIYKKIKNVTIFKEIDYFIDKNNILENHPLVLILKEKLKMQVAQTVLEEKNEFSDIKLTLGYYQREKFDDYASLNISIPLSIQGKEKLKIKKSKLQLSTLKEKLKSLQNELKTTVENLNEKIRMSKQNIDLIEKTMIPLNDTLEESHKIHLSTNMMQTLSVYESENSRFDLLLLVQDEKISYFEAISKILYFKGNL